MQVPNISGSSLNVNTIKANINNIDGLSSMEIFKLESYLDHANFYGDDENTIEEGQEKEKLISLIRNNFKDKADKIIQKLGLSGTSGAQEAPVADNNSQTSETMPVKAPEIEFIENAMKNPKLASDKTFVKYAKQFIALDNQMSTIEKNFKVKRGDLSSQLNINDSKTLDKYIKMELILNTYAPMLQDYVKEMENWQDGKWGEKSFVQRNTSRFTNLERITLKDGQKAWKSDQGVFYPYYDGGIGGNKVEDETLIP